jgi:UDP-N-acetylmuramyl pentapeptide phosphotransferase/UDP-N-acetylglucosamine-1-phosphate transferase
MSTSSAAISTFAITLVLLPPLIAFLRQRVVDTPTARSSHVEPTPRGGGLAVAIGTVAGLVLADHLDGSVGRGLGFVAVAFAAVGLADDLFGLPALLRLAAQPCLAAIALVWLLDSVSGTVGWQVVFAVGCVLWVVSYVNAFNFMDGINGISAVQAIVAGVTWAVAGELRDQPAFTAAGVLVAVAAVAFLPFNLPRARVFLGDVGSYFLGGWLATAAIVGLRAEVPPELVMAPLVLYLADTSTTIVRRVRSGEVWHEAHRSHAYQRLTQAGWSHTRTATFVGLLMAVCSACALVVHDGSVPARAAAVAAIAVVTVGYLASPDRVAARAT